VAQRLETHVTGEALLYRRRTAFLLSRVSDLEIGGPRTIRACHESGGGIQGWSALEDSVFDYSHT
jgi:hypothetical protein